MGGYVDKIRRGQIREQIGMQIGIDQNLRDLPQEQRKAMIVEMARLEEERLGLDRPFILRSFGSLFAFLRFWHFGGYKFCVFAPFAFWRFYESCTNPLNFY